MVCNLYPFVEVSQKPGVEFQAIVEEIDIGGVTLLRAAAKNHERVTVVCDPADYELVLSSLNTSSSSGISYVERKKLALKAFKHTSNYDEAISTWLQESVDADDLSLRASPVPSEGQSSSSSSESKTEQATLRLPENVHLHAVQLEVLRYGENPHQKGVLYRWKNAEYPFVQIQGKELSYNNILDLDAAYDVAFDFTQPACAIIKHLTPCGVATGKDLIEAYQKAFESDTVSAFGSIIAFNDVVTLPLVETIGQLFLEVLVAPDYTPEALSWLETKKKNCRVMRAKTVSSGAPLHKAVIRSVHGGLLVQTPDNTKVDSSKWKVVTKKQPDAEMLKALEFAWAAVKHVKSNAIVFTQGTATVGIGCGQPNRLDSVRNAAAHAGEKAKGAMCSSDAFFPFPDGVEAAASHGIVAIVQPGGSIRDDAVIEVADKLGLVMVFTGERHFKH